jgi:hypothetical protein
MQCALIQYCRQPSVIRAYPGIDLLFSSLNGVHLGKAQAGKAKAAGMLAGVYDLMLPVRKGVYVGLVLEMKWQKNQLSPEQEWFGERMREQGWRTETCWDWVTARNCIINYLTQDDLAAATQREPS